MGLKYYSTEFNNSDNISPLYANTSLLSNRKHLSRSSSSSSTEAYSSIRKDDGSTYYMEKNIYANISQLPPDTAYGTLMYATSNIDIAGKPSTLEEKHSNRTYENVQIHSTSPNNISPSSHLYINFKRAEDQPPISPKSNPKEDIPLSSISSLEIKQIDIETNVLKKRSNSKTKQTVKKFEVNLVPSCRDKSDLYRTKIPLSSRQRRTLHRPRRYRRRSSTPFRAIRRQAHHSHSNTSMISTKSVSNKLYNEMQQPIFSNIDASEYPLLEQHILAWYPAEEILPQVFSTSENGESIQQRETINEEELRPHDTFEDFLLRRRSKSSDSTLASVTNTIISSEEIPVRPPPPPLTRPSPTIALGLDKKDVDFIHDILHRTHGDQRLSNRLTALKEAYLRAENKRNELLRTNQCSRMKENEHKKKATMKHSVIATKIRDELEKYDELPAHRRIIFDDDDDDDDTYSTNEEYRYHHRKLPPTPSMAHRIISFVITLKRQLQKNFQELRSRILIEAMSNPRHRARFHHSSGPSHRPKSTQHIIHRPHSHHSIEHSYSFHRQQFSRTPSNTSQLHSYHHSSSFNKHLSNRPRTFRITPHLPR